MEIKFASDSRLLFPHCGIFYYSFGSKIPQNPMIAQTQANKTYSPQEYLEFEVNSEERHEYIRHLQKLEIDPCYIWVSA
jgi:hypothetical protein